MSARVAELLVTVATGPPGHTIELDEMVGEPEHMTHEESDRAQTASRDARVLDQQLAGEMCHRQLGGETTSAGYLRELGAACFGQAPRRRYPWRARLTVDLGPRG